MRIKNILLLLFCLAAFVQCNDKDEYYDEPKWLERPLYEVLKKEGRFSNYLQCVDRTLYAPVIKEGGLYTLFAPNDEAFEKYLREKGYASVNDIPQEEVNAIVGHSMVFSSWPYRHLGDYIISSTIYSSGVTIKKRTNYYSTVYQDPDFENQWVIDQNRINGIYDREYFSYKYLPVFTASYFRNARLTPNDYNIFFPDAEFPFSMDNQYNAYALDGKVLADPENVEYDGMIARNGIAHEVSKVVLPLPNMDKFLYNPEYSVFKSLLDFKTIRGAYVYKNYQEDPALTEFFRKLHPEIGNNKVYVKSYSIPSASSDVPAFTPIYEQYQASTSQTETDGYTLFVPTDEALKEYLDRKIYKYYPTLGEAPVEAITALINAHKGNTMYWPSQFKNATVATGEYLNGVGPEGAGYEGMNVIDQKLASNGFIYLIDRVIKCKLFETVYSRIFLDPQFSMLNMAYINHFYTSLRMELMESSISPGQGNKRFTVLLPSDEMLKADGFAKGKSATGADILENPLIKSGTADDRIKRLVRMHVFQGYATDGFSSELTSFEGDGPSQYNGWGFRVSYNGDMIRFKGGKLQAVGNVEEGTYVNATLLEEFDNGSVYSIDGDMLQYSPRHSQPAMEAGWRSKSLWQYLQDMRKDVNSATTFINYVEAAMKEKEDSDALTGISEENLYTILVVTNTSMTSAINKKLLPTLAEVQDVNNPDAKIKARNFLLSHFLAGRIYADDGLRDYLYPYNSYQPNKDLSSTSLRLTNEKLGLINARTYVSVSKKGDLLQFEPQTVTDETGQNTLVQVLNSAKVTVWRRPQVSPDNFRTNRMAGRAVLHEIQGYFAFEEVAVEEPEPEEP